MKKTGIKIFALLLLTVFMLTACTTPTTAPTTAAGTTAKPAGTTTAGTTASAWKGDANLNKPGESPICKTPVKLTIGLVQNANVSDFETNDMTKLIEKEGFDLTFKYYTSEMKTQINVLIAGGDFNSLPDILMLAPGDAFVYQWGQAGAVIDLKDYYKNSAYHLTKAKDRTGVDYMPMITSPDGKVYGIPQYNQSLGNEYDAKIWIYQPWLTKLGLKAPTTTTEFIDVMTAFATKDPNGNGKADEIPMLGNPYAITVDWMKALVNPFEFMGSNDYVNNDGKIGTWFNTNEYREALKFINSLITKKLMPDYQFTIDATAYKNLVSNTEIPIVGCVFGSGTTPTGRVGDYVGIAPLKGPSGSQYTSFAPSVANVAMMISKSCKTPEAAFRLGDLLCSEDLSIMTRWGIQGKHWDYVKNIPSTVDKSKYVAWYDKVGYPGYVIIYEDPWGIVQNFHWYQAGPFIRQYGIAAGRLADKTVINSETMIANCQGYYMDVGKATSVKKAVGKLIYTTDETKATTEVINSLETYVKENTAAFAVGQKKITDDAAWNAYVKELDNIGLQNVLKVTQTIYDRMYKK